MMPRPRLGGRLGIWFCALLAVCLSVWYCSAEVFHGAPGQFDDSYMFLRYAKHMLAGYGHAWNPDGAQSYGSTSLLYVFFVTLLRGGTELADATLLRAASASFGAAAVLVMVATAWRFSRADGLRRNLALWLGLIVPPVITSGVFIYHARTGMDTTLSLLTNAVLVYATLSMVEKSTARATAPVAVAAYLAYLARPDNGVYAALVPTLAAWFLIDASVRRRVLVTYVATMAGVVVVDALVKFAIFGVPLPLPVYAKLKGHYADYAGVVLWNPMAYLMEFLTAALPFLCVVVAFVTRRSRLLVLLLLGPVVLTLGTYFEVLQIMGYKARFSYPALPFVVAAAVLALDRAVAAGEGFAKLSAKSLAARLVVVIGLVALMPVGLRTLPAWWDTHVLRVGAPAPDVAANPAGLPRIPYWGAVRAMVQIARRAPEGALLCMSEYGMVGSEVPEVAILDPLGLHDIQVARQGFSADRLLAAAPDLIWLPHTDYVAIRRALLESETFRRDYDLYPAALLFGLAIRKQGPRAPAMRAAVSEVWTRVYPREPMAKHRQTW